MDEIAFVCFCFLAFWFSDDVFEREAVIEGKDYTRRWMTGNETNSASFSALPAKMPGQNCFWILSAFCFLAWDDDDN